MSLEPKTCPKCQGTMSEGFIVDYSHAATFASAWHPLPMVKRWFQLGIKVEPYRKRQIAAYRCESCGFLELYAPEKSSG